MSKLWKDVALKFKGSVPRRMVEEVARLVNSFIKKEIMAHRPVHINNFGTFCLTRHILNFSRKKTCYYKIAFRPDESFKSIVDLETKRSKK